MGADRRHTPQESIVTVEQWNPRTEVATVTPQDQAVQRLTDWARSAQAAHQVASSLVQTSFVPQQFRGRPEEATAAILAGLEVGLSPMSALRAFDIIQGTAAPRAVTLRAIVQAAGHEMELLESTTTRCRMRGRRKGAPTWQTITWTIERAREMGLLSRDGWKKQAQAMLVARATSELARLIASDAILGLAYSAEEVADGGPADTQVAADTVDPAPAATRRMSRRKPAPAPEPDPEPEPVEAEVVDPEPAPLNPRSNLARAMFAAMGEVGITEKSDRLAYVSDVIGRTVESSTEMTEDDARRVLDALKADAAPVAPPAEDEPDEAADEPDQDDDEADTELFDPTTEEGWGEQ
jgi:hypothetical protein